MRRILGFAAGLCTAAAMTVVADSSVARLADLTHLTARTGPGSPGPPAGRAPDASPPPATDRVADEIGTVERVGTVLDDAAARRSLTLRYPGASYVKVHFDRVTLPPGDVLVVADPTGRERYEYPDATGRWAMSVSGDTAVVRVRRRGGYDRAPTAARRHAQPAASVGIDRVARGFTPTERAARRRPAAIRPGPGTGGTESICGSDESADAVCYRSSHPVAYTRSKAVARLLIDGIELCTAWRVGPRNGMFTNQHCLADNDTARQTEVWFNYECVQCGGWDVLTPTKVWGDQVLATDRTLDYTLFTVRDFGAVRRFGFLELDTREPSRGDELYVLQHPGGEPTRIAMAGGPERGGTCAVADPRYPGYADDTDVSYYCDTRGGSSGSPVLSRRSDKVVALHHFGGCPNSGVRIELVRAAVADLLERPDPPAR
jgi:lysyl endopeptidase